MQQWRGLGWNNPPKKVGTEVVPPLLLHIDPDLTFANPPLLVRPPKAMHNPADPGAI
jgi:hypothetical protein